MILLTEGYGRNEKKHHKSLPNTVSEFCSSPFPPLSIKAGGARVLKRQKSGAGVLKERVLGRNERALSDLPPSVHGMPYIAANKLQALNK